MDNADVHLETKRINLGQWVKANVIQRQEWLQTGVELDDTSRMVLNWAYAFKDAGAYISDEQTLKVYESITRGSRA
ncbi:MAG: hypothetical protein ABSH28_00415 [Acidobacteriota bacterium]|jgi:anaerobic glycerol-3-phosphate dehydrogenase